MENAPTAPRDTGKLRLGICGAPRGRAFLAGAAAKSGRVEVTAIYDPDPNARAALAAAHALSTPDSFNGLLDLVDAVVVASPQQYHAPQAVAAVRRGIHVLSEVPAAVSLEQAQALVSAVRSSTAVYMMAENYCYTRPNLTVEAMVRSGLFGELYFGEGHYLHEMKEGFHTDARGRPTWRYYWQVGRAGNTYPTHSLGPILRWFGDRIVAVSCAGTGRHTDPEHEIDDTVITLARTSRGALVEIRLDLLSNRPHLMNYHAIQGTGGVFEASRRPSEFGWVYLKDRSGDGWEPLERYVEEFLPSRYRDLAEGAGHWGADTWPVGEFLDAVLDGVAPSVDVYTALDMTIPGIVSESSFYEGGAWRAVPNPRLWSAGIGTEPGREAPLA